MTTDTDIQKVAEEGSKIYERTKSNYGPEENGKFLAIDIESGNAYMGNTSAEALSVAREKHPGKVFYIVKIGFDAAETIAEYYTGTNRRKW